VRPEFVRLSERRGPAGHRRRVEDVGRHKIVRCHRSFGLSDQHLLGGNEPDPADDRRRFDPGRINVYADDWRVAPLRSKKGRPPDEQDRQPKGLVPRPAGAGAGRLLASSR
jgi:hypothetical protein